MWRHLLLPSHFLVVEQAEGTLGKGAAQGNRKS